MNPENFVFRDPLGRRWRQVGRATALTAALLALALVLFLTALLARPRLTSLAPGAAAGPALTVAAQPLPATMPPTPASDLLAAAGPASPATPAPRPRGLRLGFVGADFEEDLPALGEHAGELTHVASPWFRLVGMPPRLLETPAPPVATLARQHGLGLLPLLTNQAGDGFDTDAVEETLRAPASAQQAFAEHLRDRLRAIGAQGVIIAWEQLDPAYRPVLTGFIGRLHDTLAAAGLELWLNVPVGDDLRVFDLAALAPQVDRFLATLYYETGEEDPPGPIASLPWFQSWLTVLTAHGEPSQWVIGLATFGYDWPADGPPAAVSFYDSMARAQAAGITGIANDPPDHGPSFSYTENGLTHRVWFLDATTFRNQQRLVEQAGLGGVGIDRVGSGDPLIWQVLACGTACRPGDFETVPAPAVIGTVGDGDFLSTRLASAPGVRRIRVDADGRWAETYTGLPQTPVVIRRGQSGTDRVALTFDDGPDPRWTPRILDILRAARAPATFFVVGERVVKHPELLRRMLAEGHQIGNHTFSHLNLANSSDLRVELELNAAQRAIEQATGRSTLLFRPPYDADRTPTQISQLQPLLLAERLGYVPAMASIDPLDWEQPPAAELLARVKAARAEGNVLLLHDAGGNRSSTVAALPQIIAWLRARGDQIVPLSDLLGVPATVVNPAIPSDEPAAGRLVAGTGISLLALLGQAIWWFLLIATGLLLLRTGLVVGLALWRARQQRSELAPADFSPPVSVILAAYNEEQVITETLRALLKSRYPAPLEVLVVDDGSSDATAERVAALAARDRRLRLLRQANQGKAAALSAALAQCQYEIVVTLDADTLFLPDTLAELVAPLADPRVGAVSGQLRVGNRVNLLSGFQALEYLSAFNLDRRAFDALNAIAVVPGAASAWRTAAVRAVGGISADTLAEDTDLTLALHCAGWRVRHSNRALAFTEAPQTLGALYRQRKRWCFGTLQCLWKHRAMTLNPRFGWLGLFALPGVWFFQLLLVALVPLVDGVLLVSLLRGDSGPLLAYALLFLGVDLALALTACRLDGEPARSAWLVLPMRLLYRPLLSLVVLASLLRALRGTWMAWGRQERRGLGMPTPVAMRG